MVVPGLDGLASRAASPRVTSCYDDALNTYSNTIDFDRMELYWDGTECEPDTDLDALGELVDLRVQMYDIAGNNDTLWVFRNTLDTTPPNRVNITNIKLAVDDPTQDPIDFGQVTEVTRGLEVEVWGTASDDEANIPNTPVGYETMITMFQFQVAEDLNSDGNADDGVWRDLGTIIFDPADLGDPSAVTGNVVWNTTGLVVDGEYLLRLIATDECGNSTTSGTANVIIRDNIPPTARIAGLRSGHGSARRESADLSCRSTRSRKAIRHRRRPLPVRHDRGEDDTDHEWVNIGMRSPELTRDSTTTRPRSSGWTTIETTAFPDGHRPLLAARPGEGLRRQPVRR